MSPPSPRRGRQPVDAQTPPGEVTAQVLTVLGEGQHPGLKAAATELETSMAALLRRIAAWGVDRPAEVVSAQEPVPAAPRGSSGRTFPWAPGTGLTYKLDAQARGTLPPLTVGRMAGLPDRSGLLRRHIAAALEPPGLAALLGAARPASEAPTPPAGPQREVWTAEECAARWGVKTATWWYYVKNGLAPQPLPERRGNRRLWDASTVCDYRRPGAGARTDLRR